jgi:hypothetical protein
MSHRLQGSRFELKYVIDEPCAVAIRSYVGCYLVPDEHADPRRNYEYPVHTLYLDSPNYALYQATVHGCMNRFKLRVRFYDDLPESPTFFEIKARQNDVVLKQRAAVRRSSVPRLLASAWPRREDLAPGRADGFGSLQRFCGLRNILQAHGKLLLSYMREAHVSREDESIRVTLDRHIVAGAYRGVFGLVGLEVRGIPDGTVVLELKFNDRFPIWMQDLVERFDLERISFAKYVRCAQTLGCVRLQMAQSCLK